MSEIGSRYPRTKCDLELGVAQQLIALHWKSERNDSANENTNRLPRDERSARETLT
jgi:hypothetical protein